jgi:hypothetical protein
MKTQSNRPGYVETYKGVEIFTDQVVESHPFITVEKIDFGPMPTLSTRHKTLEDARRMVNLDPTKSTPEEVEKAVDAKIKGRAEAIAARVFKKR